MYEMGSFPSSDFQIIFVSMSDKYLKKQGHWDAQLYA